MATSLKDVSTWAFTNPANLKLLLDAKDPLNDVVKKQPQFTPPYAKDVEHINNILRRGQYQGGPTSGGQPVDKGWTVVHGRKLLDDLYDIWMNLIPVSPNPGKKPALKIDPWKGYE